MIGRWRNAARNTASTRCGGCGRTIDIATHRTEPPRPDVPDKCIAWRKVQPDHPRFTLLCTCGHFTVHSDLDRQRASLAPAALEASADADRPH